MRRWRSSCAHAPPTPHHCPTCSDDILHSKPNSAQRAHQDHPRQRLGGRRGSQRHPGSEPRLSVRQLGPGCGGHPGGQQRRQAAAAPAAACCGSGIDLHVPAPTAPGCCDHAPRLPKRRRHAPAAARRDATKAGPALKATWLLRGTPCFLYYEVMTKRQGQSAREPGAEGPQLKKARQGLLHRL